MGDIAVSLPFEVFLYSAVQYPIFENVMAGRHSFEPNAVNLDKLSAGYVATP